MGREHIWPWRRTRRHHDALERGADVPNLELGQAVRVGGLTIANVAQHGGLQTAEAEIEIAFELRGIAIRVRQPGRRQRNRPVPRARRRLRAPVADGPAASAPLPAAAPGRTGTDKALARTGR